MASYFNTKKRKRIAAPAGSNVCALIGHANGYQDKCFFSLEKIQSRSLLNNNDCSTRTPAQAAGISLTVECWCGKLTFLSQNQVPHKLKPSYRM